MSNYDQRRRVGTTGMASRLALGLLGGLSLASGTVWVVATHPIVTHLATGS